MELFVNGESIGKKTAADHFFYFDVPNVGESTIVAKAGELSDDGTIRKVDEMNMDYVLVEQGAVLNWFDIDAPEGRFSLNDNISAIMESFRGKLIFASLMKKVMGGKKGGAGMTAGFDVQKEDLMSMMNGFSVLRLITMVGGFMKVEFTKEQLLDLNAQLNKIKKKS